MTWLLMDMGNSRCKAVVNLGRGLESLDRFNWDNQEFNDAHWLKQFSIINGKHPSISKVLISSVSSDKRKNLVTEWVQQSLGLTPIFASSQKEYDSEFTTLKNSYDEPLALGVDRWLAMVGALERIADDYSKAGYDYWMARVGFGSPFHAFAVLDAGTAITLDLVDKDGKHLGGHIVPGAKLMQKALFGDTGKIAFGANLDPSKASEQQWLGVNSLQAVELGTYQAALSYLQSCLKRLNSHYGVKQMFVCGGDGALMMQQIQLPRNLEWVDCPDLVLEGLLYFYRREYEQKELQKEIDLHLK